MLEDNSENIDLYVSTLWYDLIDDIERNKEMYGIEQDIDDYDAGKMIENIIEKVLKDR